MFEWLQTYLPLPSESNGFLMASLWFSDVVFWTLFALFFGATALGIYLHNHAEKSGLSGVERGAVRLLDRLFKIHWAPYALLLGSSLGSALNHLSILGQTEFSTGLIGFGFGIVLALVGLFLLSIAYAALKGGASISGQNQGLKFAPPAFLYASYGAFVAFLGSALFISGAETWSIDESLWTLGFFGSFSTVQSWFQWFLVIHLSLLAAPLFLRLSPQTFTVDLALPLGKLINLAFYMLPLTLGAWILSISDHALSLFIVILSLLSLAASYGLWHLSKSPFGQSNRNKSCSCSCDLSVLVPLWLILLSSVWYSVELYGDRDQKASQTKTEFEQELKWDSYTDTAKVDSTVAPFTVNPSPNKILQLHHFE